jgi:excisionase family DNA binding protein
MSSPIHAIRFTGYTQEFFLISSKYQYILIFLNIDDNKQPLETLEMEELITLEELSKYLKISKPTLYKMVERGKIPALKIASQWRFKKDDIDGWVEKQRKN